MLQVVQCWDDGVTDDIRLIEILRKHGAKATFNLNPGLHHTTREGWYEEKYDRTIRRFAHSELLSVYEGFLIANHSSTHPHPTQIAIDQWMCEVCEAQKALQDLFQQPVSGFAYPFGDHDDVTARIVREAGHLYARTTVNADVCMPVADPMRFHANCRARSPDFWKRYERAKSTNATAFYFWGHSYEFHTEELWREFDEKIARIAADTDTKWADITDLFF